MRIMMGRIMGLGLNVLREGGKGRGWVGGLRVAWGMQRTFIKAADA